MKSKKTLYNEPHLQRQSDKCAILWKNWYNYKYGLEDEEKAKECRELWGKCVDKLGRMCSEETKTNPRYTNMRHILDK